MQSEIKRPDFLVGIPPIVAVDVKAKRVYRDSLIIDAYEHRTLSNFETDLVMAMVAARIIAPEASKLGMTQAWAATTLADDLGVTDANEDEPTSIHRVRSIRWRWPSV